jgi:diadenylate cyclase
MQFINSIIDAFSHIKPIDVVDMVIVSYIIYRVLLLLRSLGAMHKLRGILFILVVLWISSWLPTFNWLLRQAMVPGIIALVVVFAPELRIAIERLGRSTPFWMTITHVGVELQQHVINEVTDAAAEFSERGIGALIVLERDDPLMDIVRTGKQINGVVSMDLLHTIFYPKSPLHDGAVVVRGDRVLAAACVLPHSESPGLSATVGMRHRAAVGITERSDCVCVVVSEETGVISLAVGGVISPSLEKVQLVERLLGLFEAEHEHTSFFFWRR